MPTCQYQIIDLINKLDIGDVDNYGTDKICIHSYDRVYGPVLNRFKNRPGTMLEIGVRFGGSSVLWRNLLPNFRLELVDSEIENFYEGYRDLLPNSSLIEADAYTTETVDHYRNLHPDGYDVIIEDGPHTLETQIYAVQNYCNLLKPGGVLVVEDISEIEHIDELCMHIPQEYAYKTFDLRGVKGRYDDIA